MKICKECGTPCNAELSYTNWQIEEGKLVCPECDMKFEYNEGLRRQ